MIEHNIEGAKGGGGGDVIAEGSGDHRNGKGFLLAGLSVGCFLNRLIASDEIRRNLFIRLVR